MADVTEPRTALERARFGRRLGTGDRFVGFWLELAVAGRNASLGGDRRNVARTIRAFFKGTRAAVDEAGVDALHAELRDAAQLYWGSCLTDPQYSSTLFGLKRLDDAELRGKIALEYAQAARLMVDSARSPRPPGPSPRRGLPLRRSRGCRRRPPPRATGRLSRRCSPSTLRYAQGVSTGPC